MDHTVTCPRCGHQRPIGPKGWGHLQAGRTTGLCPSCRAMRHDDATQALLNTPIYWSWVHMRQRCTSPTSKAWPNYGGRGITVCDRWAAFEGFVEDMGPTWAPGLTIERVDNEGGYEPGNCRWATKSDQGKNTRRIRWITVQGRTLPVTVWLREVGLSKSTFYAATKSGQSPESVIGAALADLTWPSPP